MGTRYLSQSGSNQQGEEQRFKGIFRPKSEIQALFPAKTGDFQKKRSSSQKRHEIRCQPQKTPIWASICTPVAPSRLNSSGHCPRLGGHNFRLGGAQAIIWWGTAPAFPPWRRV